MGLKKTKDHWAFLEEIEAPMWVDLTLEEATFNSQDVDVDWFHKSHPFHQCSSRQLKAAFSCSGGESLDSDFELLGSSSPKLPSSVSRSRGKEYRSRKWRGENCDVSLNKPHPVKVLSEKSACVGVGTTKKIKSKSSFMKPKYARVESKSCVDTKSKLSFINSKETSSSKRSLVCYKSSTENSEGNSLKTISSSRDLENSSSSMVDKANESNTLSTITSESSLQRQQNIVEVSSRAFGHSGGLLSAVRISLRKSCVTRQALRVETNNNMRQSTMGINCDSRQSRIEINSDKRESRVETNSDKRESRVETNNDMRQSTMGIDSDSRQSRVETSSDKRELRVETSNDKRQSTMGINSDTRQSRVDTSSNRRESRDCKSSSSKSSVGSSSVYGLDVKSSTFISTRKKEKTPHSRDVVRMTEAPSNRVKVSNASKVFMIQDNKGTSNSRRKDITTVKKSTYKDTASMKVQSHTLSTKSSVPLRVNEQKSACPTKTREKVRSSSLNKPVGGGKENVMGKMSNSQKCSGRENAAEGVVKGQSKKQQNVPQRGVTRASATQKGKIGNLSKGKNLLSVNQGIYLR